MGSILTKKTEIMKKITPVEERTYNVHFNDSNDSDDKGFELSLEEARAYILATNGSDDSYFGDYKGGIVSIVCNETGNTVYEEEVF